MKKILKTLLVFLSVFALIPSCSSKEEPVRPEDGEVRISAGLPSTLSGKDENAYNDVVWQEGDRPVLLQIDADKKWKSFFPVQTECKEGQGGFIYELDAAEGPFRYWICKAGNTPDGIQKASISNWPLSIPAVQKPHLDAIDPAADVLISEVSFDLPQDYMSENVWNPSMSRLNAVAAISLSGIPQDHELESVVLQTQELIVGERGYQVLSKAFSGESACGNTLTAGIEGELRTAQDSDGNRTVCLSVWPTAWDIYNIKATTVDAGGNKHIYTNVQDLFTRAIVLPEHCLTRWNVRMRAADQKPDLPATPAGPEKVIRGEKGATLDLFNKMKAYADNGISSIDEWWTHQIGYEGAVIHEARMTQYGKPLHMWVLEADPDRVGFAVGTPLDENITPPRMLETVTHQSEGAVKAGKKVIAAVNGDAWGASGALYTYGVLFKDGLCLKKWAVRPNDLGDTDTFYSTETGEVGIVDETGLKAVLEKENIETAIGGWYRLISQGGEPYAQAGAADGDPLLRDKSKTNGSLRNFLDRHPRTFMGITDERVYIIAVDGRQNGWSVGLTLNGCSRICYSLGCRRAINFDGGGSTTMVKRSGNNFEVLNRPSDGTEREVANSLLVVAR